MQLDIKQFRIHKVDGFPCVVCDGRAMAPGYATEWASEMTLLIEFGQPFVVVFDHMYDNEDQKDRKFRGKWLKLNRHALSGCCKAVISIEPDEARRGEVRAIAATAVKAFGIAHEVVATREQARAIAGRILAQ